MTESGGIIDWEYVPVQFVTKETLPLETKEFLQSRLNLICVSSKKLFIALDDQLFYFPIFPGIPFSEPIALPHIHRDGINFLRAGFLGSHPVVIASDDHGVVCIYQTEKITGNRATPLLLQNSGPTWSIDTSRTLTATLPHTHPSALCSDDLKLQQLQNGAEETGYLALGSNSSNMTVYNLLAKIKELDLLSDSQQSADSLAVELRVESFITASHRHNIPCVAFSSCGKFIATASIDCCVRIWNIDSTLRYCAECTTQDWRSWFWHVRWIHPSTVKKAQIPGGSSSNQSNQELLQKFRQENHAKVYANHPECSWIGLYGGSGLLEIASGEIPGRPAGLSDSEEEFDVDATLVDDSEVLEDYYEDVRLSDIEFPPGEDAEDDEGDDGDEYVFYINGEGFQDEEDEESMGSQDEESESPVFSSGVHWMAGFDSGVPVPEPSSQPPQEGQDCEELLICCTFHSVYLMNSKLEQLAMLNNCVPLTRNRMGYMERYSLMDYIPELSLLILGSQGWGRVVLIRVVQFPTGKYELIPEKFIPEDERVLEEPLGCVTGLTCQKFPNHLDYLSYYQLYITFENGALFCYELRDTLKSGNASSLDLVSKLL